MSSSAYVMVPAYGYTYSFSGVISIHHAVSLKIQTDAESASGTDYVNGARNQPDRVTLAVIESDVGHPAGWSARMLQAMESLKRNRALCTVVTPAFTYENMLLNEFTATEDETSQSGWQGSLTFTQYVPPAGPEKTADNSSAVTHTGSAAPAKTVSGSPFQQMLERAGITL